MRSGASSPQFDSGEPARPAAPDAAGAGRSARLRQLLTLSVPAVTFPTSPGIALGQPWGATMNELTMFVLAVASGAFANLISWLVERRVDLRRHGTGTALRDTNDDHMPSNDGRGMSIGSVRQRGDTNVVSGPGSRITVDNRKISAPRNGGNEESDDLTNMGAIALVAFVVLIVTLALASTYLTSITLVILGAAVGLLFRATIMAVRHRARLRPPAAIGHIATIALGSGAVAVGLLLVHTADRGGLTLRSFAAAFAAQDGAGDGAGYVARSLEAWSSLDAHYVPHLALQLAGLLAAAVLVVITWAHHIGFADQLRGTTRAGSGGGLATSTVGLVMIAIITLGAASGIFFDALSTRSSPLVPVAHAASHTRP